MVAQAVTTPAARGRGRSLDAALGDLDHPSVRANGSRSGLRARIGLGGCFESARASKVRSIPLALRDEVIAEFAQRAPEDSIL